MLYTYSVPTTPLGEPIVRIKIRKKEKVIEYKIYPDKHVFTSDKYHVELKDFLIGKKEE